MNVSIISFTSAGSRLSVQIKETLTKEGMFCEAYTNKRYAKNSLLKERKGSLFEWTKSQFFKVDAIIYIGATGIAVRSVAPFLVNKKNDPAVIVIDEKGTFVISLLSGHLGGANRLTELIATKIKAVPVITTATDINQLFAVDVFAKKNKLLIKSFPLAKEISAALLDKKEVGLVCDFPVEGTVPKELKWIQETENSLLSKKMELGICISARERKEAPFQKTLYLIPPIVTLGIGCKKGTGKEVIEELAERSLYECGYSWNSVEQIASIDLKKEEEGLCQMAKEHGILFRTFQKEMLAQLIGEFTESDFVEQVTGVSNVCERSAVLGSKNGRLVQKKRAENGVTVAIAERDWRVKFDE
ncbi:cobalt-precorrin 5A hydrolase [Velocimicrobium porci]|uniref:Cobalt-precorrin 5A hydrolase n=1 Tax=Velocimicrobium porci TaxID=2606634 RepID=A0A6L5XVX9_9FIRM|nr:cobalt-precorrin 5A hydrolase [Velocimicrobium porci]MSS62508.1 cobalt-precorrin 5A hydrolase [Velocimicrobium porci]